jgi:hypothetical protein
MRGEGWMEEWLPTPLIYMLYQTVKPSRNKLHPLPSFPANPF